MPHFTHWSAASSGKTGVGSARMGRYDRPPGAPGPEQQLSGEKNMRLRTLGWLCLVPLPALAADPPPPWSGEVSAGLVVTSGNTKSSTMNGKAQAVYTSERWRNTSDALGLNTTTTDPLTGDDVRTAERYLLGNKTDFNFTEHDYAFLALE